MESLGSHHSQAHLPIVQTRVCLQTLKISFVTYTIVRYRVLTIGNRPNSIVAESFKCQICLRLNLLLEFKS